MTLPIVADVRIRGWIQQMPRKQVETLMAAYEERAFPERTKKTFGLLAGIAVRLDSAREAFDAAPIDRITRARTVCEWIEEKLARDGLRGVASLEW